MSKKLNNLTIQNFRISKQIYRPHIKQADTLVQLKKYTEARLKLSDIKNQFKGTRFDTLARVKLNDLDNLEKQEFYSNQNKTINNFYNK